MTSLFKKLNYKNDMEIAIINAPDSFQTEMIQMSEVCKIVTVKDELRNIKFFMQFVNLQEQINDTAMHINTWTEGDAVVWFVYPKKSSGQFSCDFDRDHGWDRLKDAGWDTVRIVAVDEDWSALRFRKVPFIKKMKV